MSSIRRAVVLTTASILFAPHVASAATWTPPSTLSATGARSAQSLQIETDATGTFTAAWSERDAGGDAKVFTATRVPGGSWSEPKVIGDPASPTGVHLSVSPTGHALVSWTDQRRYTFVTNSVTQRTPSGVWSTPQDVQPASPYPDASGQTTSQAFAVGPDGGAVGVWSRSFWGDLRPVLFGREFKATSLTPGGSWTLDDSAPQAEADTYKLAVDGAGTATLLFRGEGDGRIQVSNRPAGGAWSTPKVIAPGATPFAPGVDQADSADPPALESLAVNDAGAAVATWTRRVGLENRLEVVRSTSGGSWSAPETLASVGLSGSINVPKAKIDAVGRTTAVWSSSTSPDEGSRSDILSATSERGGAWSAPVPLAPGLITPTGSTSPIRSYWLSSFDVAGSGRAIATWIAPTAATSSKPAGARVDAAVRESGTGGFGTPKTLDTTATYPTDRAGAINAAGDASVMWTDDDFRLRVSDLNADPAPPAKATATMSATLSPFFTSRCPATAVVWTSHERATLAVKPTTSGPRRCIASGTLVLKNANTKPGTRFLGIVTAAGMWPAVVFGRVDG